MRRRLINLLSVVTIAGGGVLLARPAHAAALAGCTEEQWETAAAANSYCQGATFSPDCSSAGVIVVEILYCPPH